MMTKTLKSKILMLVLAVLASLAAHADNYLYLEGVSIPSSAVGSEITIPVKASFDSYVSIWDVQFTLPEGLTLRRVRAGSDMNVSYCNDFGDEQISVGQFSFISGASRCIGMLDLGIDHQLNEFGEYDQCGTVKWGPGQYNEMLLLTIRVDDGFNGGDIIINTKTSCGYDTRLVPNPFTPSSPETVDGVILGDVNHDGMINVVDLTWYVDYFSANETDYVLDGDIVHDGVNDIMDVTKLRDVLLFGECYDGYVMTQAEKVINLPKPANNYLYVDEVRIPASAVGSEITIPVKASFDSYVSFWDVQFTLPEGLTLRRLKAGNDMNVSYCDELGEEQVSPGMLATGSDITHCIGIHNSNCDYQLNENGEYEFCGLVKWRPGQYDEMLLLTVRVEDGFYGGDIIVNTKTTCGYDTRNEYSTLTPSTLESDGDHYPGDVNQDGMVSISDFTCVLNYLLGENDYFCSQCADVVQDGAIDIMDACKLMDLLLTGEWYDGYVLTQAEKVINLPEPILYGDVNGDGDVNIADVTSLVDILLSQYGYYDVHVDMNGDGIVTVSDLTIIIDILLGNR